jgi:hypothetical protein
VGKTNLPGPIERRHLIERELSAAQALRHAEAYLEAECDIDALAFLLKAEATDQLQAMRARAIEAGDVFLLRSVASAMDEAPSAEEWKAVSDAAARTGKARYSTQALQQAGRGES